MDSLLIQQIPAYLDVYRVSTSIKVTAHHALPIARNVLMLPFVTFQWLLILSITEQLCRLALLVYMEVQQLSNVNLAILHAHHVLAEAQPNARVASLD